MMSVWGGCGAGYSEQVVVTARIMPDWQWFQQLAQL